MDANPLTPVLRRDYTAEQLRRLAR